MSRKEGASMNRKYYSVFGPYIMKFIELKHSLGYKYKDAGYVFASFDRLALEKDVFELEVTKDIAEEYCKQRPNETDKTRYNRIQILSQFTQFLCDLGFESYIPKLPKFTSTYTPYIFPINFHDKYLVLRDTKNNKDRMVPISDSLAIACKEYLMYRNLFPSIRKENRFFIKPDGSSMNVYNVYKWFRRIIFTANISHGGRGHGPRLHDLRHTFSVHSLAFMSESEMDLYYSLPLLSTYLGHQSLEATDKYVRLTAEMYPDLIKKTSNICSIVFPVIDTNTGNDETD
jgi:hypothetical protein